MSHNLKNSLLSSIFRNNAEDEMFSALCDNFDLFLVGNLLCDQQIRTWSFQYLSADVLTDEE